MPSMLTPGKEKPCDEIPARLDLRTRFVGSEHSLLCRCYFYGQEFLLSRCAGFSISHAQAGLRGVPGRPASNSLALYPSSLLFFVMPFDAAFKFGYIFHIFLGGLFFYLLCHEWGLSPWSSLWGSVLYSFCGFNISLINLNAILNIVALFPLLIWATHRALKHRRLGDVALGALVLALQLLNAEVFTLLGIGAFVMAYALWSVFGSRSDPLQSENRFRRGTSIAIVAAMAALAVALSCVQWLPTAELIESSGRGTGYPYGHASFWSLHPLSLLQAVFPNFYGIPPFTSHYKSYWGFRYHDGHEPYILSTYLTAFAVALSVAGLVWSSRRRLVGFVAFSGLGSLLLAMGKFTPLFDWLYQALPFFSMGRYPVKFFFITNFCLILLSALGLEALFSEGCAGRLTRFLRFLMAVAAILLTLGISVRFGPLFVRTPLRSFLVHSLSTEETPARVIQERMDRDLEGIRKEMGNKVSLTALFLLGSSFASLLFVRGKISSRGCLAALSAILTLDLFAANIGLNPYIGRGALEEIPEVASWISKEEKGGPPFRIYTPYQNLWIAPKGTQVRVKTDSIISGTLFFKHSLSELGTLYHFQYALHRTVDDLAPLPALLWRERLKLFTPRQIQEALTLFNVKYVLEFEDIRDPRYRKVKEFDVGSPDHPLKVYRNDHAAPRAFLVRKKSPVTSPERFPKLSLDRDIILEELKEGKYRPRWMGERLRDSQDRRVRIISYRPEEVLLRAVSDEEVHLVLTDTCYPGWEATLNGIAVPMERAAFIFRAVAVPPGDHAVRFVYRPKSFRRGATVTLLGLGIVIVIFAIPSLRGRRL